MASWLLLLAGVVLCSLVLVLAACMRSSQLSQQEEAAR